MGLDEIIEGCRKEDNAARKALYDHFAGPMYGVIRRYIRDPATAEDLLHDGFITIYCKIGEWRGTGPFAAWCRKIMVNTALTHLRRRDPLAESAPIEPSQRLGSEEVSALERLSAEELRGLLDRLPTGFRTVLNLYAVEGYSHKEIAQMLSVSEVTSRTQYARARSRLAEMIRSIDEEEQRKRRA